MKNITGFAQRHSVLVYYILTFAISWGVFILVGGPGFFLGTGYQSDPRFPLAILAMLTGPTIASLLLTGLLSGRAGLRELLAWLLRWRVGARWYAIALLTAPLLVTAVLFVLSLASPVFLPPIITADDKAAMLLPALGVALTTVLEELGWTGFAIPRLRRRYSVFTTALIVGILWGAWHVLQISWVGRTSAAEVPLALFLSLYFLSSVAQLTAYRVLMVWVYERTESLLVATLMHGGYAACTLPFLLPPLTGTSFVVYAWVFSAALWVVVAAVGVGTGGWFARQSLRTRVA